VQLCIKINTLVSWIQIEDYFRTVRRLRSDSLQQSTDPSRSIAYEELKLKFFSAWSDSEGDLRHIDRMRAICTDCKDEQNRVL